MLKETTLLLHILNTADWGSDSALVRAFLRSDYYILLRAALERLNTAALYQSPIHGIGHILRTMTHGAMGCWQEETDLWLTLLVLDACSYHDVGRVDDSLDDDHGLRSAQRLKELTARYEGDKLNMLRCAVDAHARKEDTLPQLLNRYRVKDEGSARLLTKLLKDADGLDRVRIWDLDPKYLRLPHSKQRVDFAQNLYFHWQEQTGGEKVPGFVQKWKHIDKYGKPIK